MNNEFTVIIPITRAYKGEDGYTYVEGVASSTEKDSHDTIFNRDCQEGFAFDIESSAGTYDAVKLEAEHLGHVEPISIIGTIARAEVTSDAELFVSAILDVENPKGTYYWNALTNPDPKLGRPKKFGLSINGIVREWHVEDGIRVFDRVKLEKIGIVREPSNPSTWVSKIARSVDWTTNTKENSMEENLNPGDQAQVEVTTEEVATEVVTEVATEVVTEVVTEVATTEVEEVTDENAQEVRSEEVEEVKTEETTEEAESRAVSPKIVDAVSAAIRAMQSCLDELTTTEEVQESMTSTTSAAGVHEDVSDEVTYTERTEEVVTPNLDSVLEATAAVTKELVDALEVRMTEKIDELLKQIDSVTRKFEASEAEKVELVERLAKIENSPATTPGAQIVVTRNGEVVDDRKLAYEKAKEKRDIHSMFKIALNLDKLD